MSEGKVVEGRRAARDLISAVLLPPLATLSTERHIWKPHLGTAGRMLRQLLGTPRLVGAGSHLRSPPIVASGEDRAVITLPGP